MKLPFTITNAIIALGGTGKIKYFQFTSGIAFLYCGLEQAVDFYWNAQIRL